MKIINWSHECKLKTHDMKAPINLTFQEEAVFGESVVGASITVHWAYHSYIWQRFLDSLNGEQTQTQSKQYTDQQSSWAHV